MTISDLEIGSDVIIIQIFLDYFNYCFVLF